MTDRARLHRDGKGATFVGAGGYTGYRLLRIAKGKLHPESKWAVVRERHQRHGTLETILMPLRKWKALLAEAREQERREKGRRS